MLRDKKEMLYYSNRYLIYKPSKSRNEIAATCKSYDAV